MVKGVRYDSICEAVTGDPASARHYPGNAGPKIQNLARLRRPIGDRNAQSLNADVGQVVARAAGTAGAVDWRRQ